MTSTLRPDEKATESEIRRAQSRTRDVRSGLETASSLGTAGLAGKAASNILPFLSEYIPHDLAFKGINKVMPGLGDFLKKGEKQGLTLKSGLDFLKEQFKEKESAKEDRNIIQQYSPDLNQFIKDQLTNGRSVMEAGALAEMGGKFKKEISQMVKDHKAPWSSILQNVFGGEDFAKNDQEAQMSPNPQSQQAQPQQQTQGQPGSGQQALMQMLQKINQRMGQ